MQGVIWGYLLSGYLLMRVQWVIWRAILVSVCLLISLVIYGIDGFKLENFTSIRLQFLGLGKFFEKQMYSSSFVDAVVHPTAPSTIKAPTLLVCFSFSLVSTFLSWQLLLLKWQQLHWSASWWWVSSSKHLDFFTAPAASNSRNTQFQLVHVSNEPSTPATTILWLW